MKAWVFALAIGLAVAGCASGPGISPNASDRQLSSFGPNEYAAQKLRSKGLNEEFLQLILQHYKENERDKVLDLNFLGFLRPNQSTGEEAIPGWELKRVRDFLRHHRKVLTEVEKRFNVEKEVIASLLWVETKHGKDPGSFHVASAFVSLVEADYPTLLDKLLDTAKQRAKDYDKVMEAKLQERARTKSDWAAGELLSLQEIHLRGWKDITKLRGSFSGAFGMAQFVPSSYLTWAKGKKQKPNLFRADDSIYSVANYLASNGWQKQSREKKEGALFHYNRDRAYVTRILKMSDCLKKIEKGDKAKRKMASIRSC